MLTASFVDLDPKRTRRAVRSLYPRNHRMHARTIINGCACAKAISPGGLNLSLVALHQQLMAS
jgi:hypothetical protein